MPKAKKTKAGTWKVTIYDYKDSTGKVHQKSFTAETKRDAERLATEYRNGPKLSDLTVGEAVKGYIDSKKNVLSPSTHRSYMAIYRAHFAESRFGSVIWKFFPGAYIWMDAVSRPEMLRTVLGDRSISEMKRCTVMLSRDVSLILPKRDSAK